MMGEAALNAFLKKSIKSPIRIRLPKLNVSLEMI